jgi:hypothetical protein
VFCEVCDGTYLGKLAAASSNGFSEAMRLSARWLRSFELEPAAAARSSTVR